MKRLAALAAGLFAMMTALAAGASALGTLIWIPPAILAFDCALPCWHSVRPGETSLEEAEALIGQVLPGITPARGADGYALSYTPKEAEHYCSP